MNLNVLLFQAALFLWSLAFILANSLFTYDLSNSYLDWYNVNKQVIASSCIDLNLSNNNLSGAIPNGAFNLFKMMQRLDMKNNQITELKEYSFYYHMTIGSSFSNENKLHWLPLSLHTLILSNNDIQILTFNWIDGLVSTLKYLDVSNNKIKHISEKFYFYVSDFLRLVASNNPLDCMRVVLFRNISVKQLNLTCYENKSLLWHAFVNVPISSNTTKIRTNSNSFFHSISIQIIPIQNFIFDKYLFRTKSVQSRYELSCIYTGDNFPQIVWYLGEKALEKSLDPKLFYIEHENNKHNGEISSKLTGSVENNEMNLTCRFILPKSNIELNQVSYCIRKRESKDYIKDNYMPGQALVSEKKINYFNLRTVLFVILCCFGLASLISCGFLIFFWKSFQKLICK